MNTRKLWSIRVIRIVLARSPARGDMENAGERLHTIRATGMAPLSRNCEKCRFLHFGVTPAIDGPEDSAQAAPRTANSMGTRLAAPILKSALIAMLVAFPKSQSQRNPLVCEIQILMIKYRRSMFFMPYFIQTRPIILKDEPSPLSTAGRLIGWLNLTKFVAVQYWHWRTPQRAGKCTPTEPTSA